MRRKIVAGNWKMNTSTIEGVQLIKDIIEDYSENDTTLIVCPPFTHLSEVKNAIGEGSNIKLGAQNCHQETNGAYTGEISIPMLKSVGVQFIIVGHSERREYFNESNELLKNKVDAILANGLTPIFCCGEELSTREEGKHFDWIQSQIVDSLFHLNAEDFSKIVIAYEPIWAIGTGITASTEQAQEVHSFIRNIIDEKYGSEISNAISILYGGSCKPGNAPELFANEDVDGGLIGGASLKSEDFLAIGNSF